MLRQGSAQVSDTPEGGDEWSRVGEYLDRLAFENDRLEAELKIKKERRLAQGVVSASSHDVVALRTESRFDEARETVRYEAQSASDTTQNMHLSYDSLKRDLSGLMSDLNDFKHTRAGLESRLNT